MTTTRPRNLAEAYGLPPDTPLNLVISRGLNMHAINRAIAVKKQYDLDHTPAEKAPEDPLAKE